MSPFSFTIALGLNNLNSFLQTGSVTFTETDMAAVATRTAVGQEKRGDDLYDLFRALALAQSGYNVSESQIKAAFNDELSQPGGREAVAATIRLCGGCPPPSRLDKEVSVDNATVMRNVNEMTVNMAFDGSFPLASALANFRGGLFGKGENYLRCVFSSPVLYGMV